MKCVLEDCQCEVVHIRRLCSAGHDVMSRPDGTEIHVLGHYEPNSETQEEPPRQGLKMPFGKHKGKLLEDLPIDYIKWCLENIDNLRDELREEMQNQVILKSGGGVVRQEVKREGTKFTFAPKK